MENTDGKRIFLLLRIHLFLSEAVSPTINSCLNLLVAFTNSRQHNTLLKKCLYYKNPLKIFELLLFYTLMELDCTSPYYLLELTSVQILI